MYLPSAFEIKDPAKLAEVISRHSFAILISKDGDSVFASHLPFLHRPERGNSGILISHMARANRHWQLFNEKDEVLVIFTGPHAYVSPSWYVAEMAVPTWNYVTVHVYGKTRIMGAEPEIDAVLDETVKKHESGLAEPWVPRLPSDLRAKLREAIVAFEIEITRIEGKFKLGQNRSAEDQEKMLHNLQNSPDLEANQLADFIGRQAKG